MVRERKLKRNVPKKFASPPAARRQPAVGGAAERALAILTSVAEAGVGVSLADLSDRLGLPKASLHRLCGALLGRGLLVRDVDPLRFVVGPTLRRLAFAVLNHGHARALRHRVLESLVADVNETCNFTTLDGAEVLYLDRVEAGWPLRLTLDVGARVPIHCTASGKLFLAYLPDAERDRIIGAGPLTRLTRNTIVEPTRLRRECEVIRAQGYATDREEFIAGLIAVAVPVSTSDGKVTAAIALHAPTARLSLAQALARLPRLRRAAKAMGSLL